MISRIFSTTVFSLWLTLLAAQPKIQLTDFSTGFSRPVDIAHAGDSRLFIVEQGGKIWIIDSLGVKVSNTPFLDIDPQVNSSGNEQGLLGLAFHPDYATNGWFYVYYTVSGAGTLNGDMRLSRFTRSTSNPNLADPNSEKIFFTEDDPYSNHNGGGLKFGPDGYLYLGIGDAGSGGDPQNNGQKKNTFFGKILRFDVNNGDPYGIPAGNPFVNDVAYRPEIWHLGLRNPWRISFDKLTGDLWIGDVGQNAWEEIDFQPAGVGGLNYGWRCYEGNATFNTSGCLPASNFTLPVYAFQNTGNSTNACSVTGGFVYRGSKYPDLFGYYIFTDYCSGKFWVSKPKTGGGWTTEEIANLDNNQFSTFGEDINGELYVAQLSTGKIQKIKELCSLFQVSGQTTDATCSNSNDGAISLSTANGTGNLTYTWNTGGNTQNLASLSPGTYSVLVRDGNNCTRRDTFEISYQNQAPAAPVWISLNQLICVGDTATFVAPDAPQGFGYQWFRNGLTIPGETSKSLRTALPGTYQFQATGQPCNSELSSGATLQVLTQPLPEVFVSNDTLTSSEAGFQIQWFLDDEPIPGANEQVYIAKQTGNYKVEVSNGVCAGFSQTVFVEISGTKLPAEVLDFNISPNPAAHEFFAEMNLKFSQKTTFRLTDANDKTLMVKHLQGKNLRQQFDVSALPAGTYFLKIDLEKSGSFARRFVKSGN